MKKELSINSIKPKRLRERTRLSLLQKTAIYRFHNEGAKKYDKWFDILNPMEKAVVCLLGLMPFTPSRIEYGQYLKTIKL